MARKDKNTAKAAIRQLVQSGEAERTGHGLLGTKEGNSGKNIKGKQFTGGGPPASSAHRAGGYTTGYLKKVEAQKFNRLQQARSAGNEQRADRLKGVVSGYRHKLTQRLLGNPPTRDFKTHLGQAGSGKRQQVRQLLKGKLGQEQFARYYHTGGGQGHQPTPHQGNLGNVDASGRPPVPTTGRRIGPPNRRRRSGFGGY